MTSNNTDLVLTGRGSRIDGATQGVNIYGNESACWNSSLSIEWFRYHLTHAPQLIILLWDEFSGHWTEKVKAYYAIALLINLRFLQIHLVQLNQLMYLEIGEYSE